MNQILFHISLLFILIFSCKSQKGPVSNNHENIRVKSNLSAIKINGIDTQNYAKNICSIIEDKSGGFWFATDGKGVCRYDGKSYHYYTKKDGLGSDFVWSIQEDNKGNIWVTTTAGICMFNGKSFIDYTPNKGLYLDSFKPNLEYKPACLWFGDKDGVYRYDGERFTHYIIHPSSYHAESNNLNRPYSVYCILEDKTLKNSEIGLWLATEQKGVCYFNGKSYTWYTEKGLTIGAIRNMFQDKAGNIWFASNGGGVIKFNGKSFINFSEEKAMSRNLSTAFLEDESQLLNRVWSITEDNNGNIWFGTVDEGAWRYDGKNFSNFSTKDGLCSNRILTIYKDKSGILWFGTDSCVSKFDGKLFTSFQL